MLPQPPPSTLFPYTTLFRSFPFSPAAEFSGTIESVGAGVTGVKPGDRVMSYAGYGAARERVVWKADRLVKLPGNLDFERADRKSTRLNSSHSQISYAVFCLK